VSRPSLEVADIFRDHGQAWRRAAKGVSGAGHVSLTQLTVMAAIEACRTAALGGHVAACADCSHTHIAYNSCRNRHCPKCQGVAATASQHQPPQPAFPIATPRQLPAVSSAGGFPTRADVPTSPHRSAAARIRKPSTWPFAALGPKV
jgi:hypothetical protein